MEGSLLRINLSIVNLLFSFPVLVYLIFFLSAEFVLKKRKEQKGDNHNLVIDVQSPKPFSQGA